jgi:hypothetical protein
VAVWRTRLPATTGQFLVTTETWRAVAGSVTGDHTLRKAVAEQVNIAGSVLYRDKHSGYVQLGREFLRDESVDYSAGEHVRYRDQRLVVAQTVPNRREPLAPVQVRHP